MTEKRSLPDGGARFQIALKKQGSGEISGTILGAAAKPVPFSSLSRMLILLEERMDFWQTQPENPPSSGLGTMDLELEIYFRQNYSWQGRFRMSGAQRYTAFHSVLELVILLEAALER